MTKRSLSDLDSGTHVVFDGHGADHLVKLGVTNIVRAVDRLSVGPSRLDVVQHDRDRQAWFCSTETWDHLYSAEVRWEVPVVVWATPNLDDRLNLWRTCSWLRDKGISRQHVFIVDLPPTPRGPDAVPRTESFGCGDSVFYQSKDAIQARLAAARPWPRERHDHAAMLWRQFVDPDPRHFALSCQTGVREFHEIGFIWSFFSRFFPRLSLERTLHLSRYDEVLLRALSARWRTPLKVYISDMIQQYSEFFSCVGDLTVVDRLAAWAAHDAGSVVERAPGPRDPKYPMLSSVYRLTKRGRELRVAIPEIASAPRMPVGGAEVYAPEAPWVLRDDGRLVRVGGKNRS